MALKGLGVVPDLRQGQRHMRHFCGLRRQDLAYGRRPLRLRMTSGLPESGVDALRVGLKDGRPM